MKLFSIFLISATLVLIACSGPSKTKAVDRSVDNNTDSIEYYETDFEARQVSFKAELMGKWKVETMQRQQKADKESLNGIYLEFADSLFSGKAPCNSIHGEYVLKGTGISFVNVASTKMACEQLEQEYAYLKLLSNTVSAFSIDGNTLRLRDGSSNIVFVCTRAND